MIERFNIDQNDDLWRWLHTINVRCPSCDANAVSVAVKARAGKVIDDYLDLCDRIIICAQCAYSDHAAWSVWGYAHQPGTFGEYELWFQVDTPQGTIHAFNREHLSTIRNFIGADLRERDFQQTRNNNYFSRLPKWMKSSKNRDMVLKHIDKILAA